MLFRTVCATVLSVALVAPQVAFADQSVWTPVPGLDSSVMPLKVKCKPGAPCGKRPMLNKRKPIHMGKPMRPGKLPHFGKPTVKPKPPFGGPKPPFHHHKRPPHFRPFYRSWHHQPYYGLFFAGITLGTIIAATREPPPPNPYICWYWANPAQTRGYWDYCY